MVSRPAIQTATRAFSHVPSPPFQRKPFASCTDFRPCSIRTTIGVPDLARSASPPPGPRPGALPFIAVSHSGRSRRSLPRPAPCLNKPLRPPDAKARDVTHS